MRVVIVVHGFPPRAMGGTEIYAESHARELARAGDDVLVIAREADPSAPEHRVRREVCDGFAVVWINNTFAAVRSFAESYDHPVITARAAEAIDAFRPDIAHVHHLTCLSTSILTALSRRRVPIVMTLHDYWPICHRGQLLDTSMRLCAGPEPDGCASCVPADAAGAGPVLFAGARVLRGATQVLPARVAERVLAIARRVVARGAEARGAGALAAAALGAAARGSAAQSTSSTGLDRANHAPQLGSASQHASAARMRHMRDVLSHVTLFIAPSLFIRDRFVRFGIDPSRISVREIGLPGIAPEPAPEPEPAPAPEPEPAPAPEPEPAPRNPGTPEPRNPVVAGFLGSLMVSKAPHLLFEAAALLPADSIRVEIAGAFAAYHGDASYETTFRRAAAAAGSAMGSATVRGPLARDEARSVLRGPLARDEVPAFLRSLDVLVVPSIWPENSPLVIREAFAAGVPVVASRIGGIPEMVDDGRNGMLFQPGDSPDLALTLKRLIEEPGLLDELRRNLPGPVRTIAAEVAELRAEYAVLTGRVATPPRDANGPPPSRSIGPTAPEAMSPQRGTAPLVAVVLNYRSPDDTWLAVRSLLLSDRRVDHIVVVDNDDTPAARLGGAPTLALPPSAGDRLTRIAPGRNVGFAAGVNLGITEALARGAERILLLNSDALIGRHTVAALERALNDAPGAGIAAPVLLDRRNPDCVASAGISFNRATGRMRNENAPGAAGAGRAAGVAGVGGAGGPGVWRVDAASGCALLITRDAFARVGLFDEDYFFSFEDIDFCARAADAGIHTVVATAATVLHEGSRSIGAASPQRLYFGARNQLLAARRTNRDASGLATAARATFIVGLNVAHAFRATGGSLTSRLLAVARGSLDYARGRFGDGRAPSGVDRRSSRGDGGPFVYGRGSD